MAFKGRLSHCSRYQSVIALNGCYKQKYVTKDFVKRGKIPRKEQTGRRKFGEKVTIWEVIKTNGSNHKQVLSIMQGCGRLLGVKRLLHNEFMENYTYIVYGRILVPKPFDRHLRNATNATRYL